MNEDKKVKLVVFDWAGTTVDYGCMAPLTVLKKTFESKKIELSKEDILKPMGMEKRDHIRALLEMENVNEQWKNVYGVNWTEDDIDELYEIFESSLAEVVASYSSPIMGIEDTVKKLKDMNVKIGSTTGYTAQMMENVIPRAKEEGYEAEYVVTPEIVGAGRPSPFMIYENMRKLNVYPIGGVVKVGDTVMDILEGVNAGAWTVGILEGSSEVGLSMEEMQTLSEKEILECKEKAAKAYTEAGADFVINNIVDLPGIIEKINMLLNEEQK